MKKRQLSTQMNRLIRYIFSLTCVLFRHFHAVKARKNIGKVTAFYCFCTLFASSLVYSSSALSAADTDFGESISINSSQSLSIEQAIEQFENQKNSSSLLITAKVKSICVVKGCWMGLEHSSDEVRVTFKNYGFFVPPSLVGKKVDIQGEIKKVTLSLKDTKHFIKDAGGDPETVTEPRVEYQIIATGVRLHAQ